MVKSRIIIASIFLMAMLTLLLGKSVHILTHHHQPGHCCASVHVTHHEKEIPSLPKAKAEFQTTTDLCKICNYLYPPLFSEGLSFVQLVNRPFVSYTDKYILRFLTCTLVLRQSRAPPTLF